MTTNLLLGHTDKNIRIDASSLLILLEFSIIELYRGRRIFNVKLHGEQIVL